MVVVVVIVILLYDTDNDDAMMHPRQTKHPKHLRLSSVVVSSNEGAATIIFDDKK